MVELPSLKSSLLGGLLIVVALAGLTNTISADQTVTVTTTLQVTSCVSVQTANVCSGVPTAYIQALGVLILAVLILAAVVALFLIRLYRRTKF
jgi:hypothetical protein